MTDRCFLIVFGFLFIHVVSGCNHSGQRREPDERQIIADYGSYPFTDWIDWSVSYREGAGYYLACYEHGDTFDKILFFKKKWGFFLVDKGKLLLLLWLRLKNLNYYCLMNIQPP